jgi:hypothetical protein
MCRKALLGVARAIVALVGSGLVLAAPASGSERAEDASGDAEECQQSAHPYAACMIARGYRVVVMNFGTVDANVEAVRPLLPEVIAADLSACREVVEARAHLLEGASSALRPASAPGLAERLLEDLDRVYIACLRPRGYNVTPWDGH